MLSPRSSRDRDIEHLPRPDDIGVSQAIGRGNDSRRNAKGLGDARDRVAALHLILMDRYARRDRQASVLVEQNLALARRHLQNIRRAPPRRRDVLAQLGIEVVQHLTFDSQKLSRRFQIDILPIFGQFNRLVRKGWLFSLGFKTKKLGIFGNDGRGHKERHVVFRFAR